MKRGKEDNFATWLGISAVALAAIGLLTVLALKENNFADDTVTGARDVATLVAWATLGMAGVAAAMKKAKWI